jgi:ABC-type Na+ efflux pump permease subunit
MLKTWLVLKNEFLFVVGRRSFVLTLLLVPLIGFVVTLVVSALQSGSNTGASNVLQELISPPVKLSAEGFVDLSGLAKVIPPSQQKRLIAYASETQAKQAMRI